MVSKQIKRPNPDKDHIRKRLFVAGLVVFLLVDAGLVALALRPRDTASAPATQMPTAEASVVPQVTPEPEPTRSSPVTVATIAPTRILAARDGELAWRATTGPCGAPALPEFTTDAGETWLETTATGPTGVVSLQSIVIEGPQVASMIGQNPDDCAAMFVRTFVAGDNYAEYSADLDGAWFVNPTDRAVIHSTTGDIPAPCDQVIALAPHSDLRASALCDDGAVYVTADGAQTWSTVAATPGAMTIATVGEGYGVATVGDPTCSGVRLGLFIEPGANPIAPVVPGACVENALSPEALAGQIAMADGAGTLWLWAGDSIVRSSDGGLTWL